MVAEITGIGPPHRWLAGMLTGTLRQKVTPKAMRKTARARLVGDFGSVAKNDKPIPAANNPTSRSAVSTVFSCATYQTEPKGGKERVLEPPTTRACP